MEPQSLLPTAPIVALQRALKMRTSPEASLSVTVSLSRAMTCASVPAERASFAPWPATSSTACTNRPSGIWPSGRQLPTVASAFGPLITFMPTLRPSGARMYVFTPSAYSRSARFALRLGSYAIALTSASTPSLARRKSTMR